MALVVLSWPKPLQAQSVNLGGRDPNRLVVQVDATVGNLGPATNVEWACGLRPVYEMDAPNMARFLRLADILTAEDPAWLPIQQERTACVAGNDIVRLFNNKIHVATPDMYALSRSA